MEYGNIKPWAACQFVNYHNSRRLHSPCIKTPHGLVKIMHNFPQGQALGIRQNKRLPVPWGEPGSLFVGLYWVLERTSRRLSSDAQKPRNKPSGRCLHVIIDNVYRIQILWIGIAAVRPTRSIPWPVAAGLDQAPPQKEWHPSGWLRSSSRP